MLFRVDFKARILDMKKNIILLWSYFDVKLQDNSGIKDVGLSLLLSICPPREFGYICHPSSVTSHITLFCCFFSSDSGYSGWMQSGHHFFTSSPSQLVVSCPNSPKKHVNLDHLWVNIKHFENKVYERFLRTTILSFIKGRKSLLASSTPNLEGPWPRNWELAPRST